jgi:hypothetical protein
MATQALLSGEARTRVRTPDHAPVQKARLVLEEWMHQPVHASQKSQTRIPKAQYK